MPNTNLSLNFNSPTTSNFFILPLFFNYSSGAQVRLLLSATKYDVTSLLTGLDQTFNQPEITSQEFYQTLDALVHPPRPFRGTVTLTAVFIDTDSSILVFTFGGSVILQRGQKAGILAAGNSKEPVAKAGQLKASDTLVLFNSPSPVLTKPLVENLEQAASWTDFSLFGQAFLAQADFENLGFYLINQSILDQEFAPAPQTGSTYYEAGSNEDRVTSSSRSSVMNSDADDEEEDEVEKMGFFSLIRSKVPFLNRSKKTANTDDAEEETENTEFSASDQHRPLPESDDAHVFPETNDQYDNYSAAPRANSGLGSIDSQQDGDDLDLWSRRARPRPHTDADDFNLDKLDEIYRRRS